MRRIESDDPYAFVAIGFPNMVGHDPHTEMAKTFIEEYLIMGVPSDEIIELFHDPQYRGPYAILQAKGKEFVSALIEEITLSEGKDA